MEMRRGFNVPEQVLEAQKLEREQNLLHELKSTLAATLAQGITKEQILAYMLVGFRRGLEEMELDQAAVARQIQEVSKIISGILEFRGKNSRTSEETVQFVSEIFKEAEEV